MKVAAYYLGESMVLGFNSSILFQSNEFGKLNGEYLHHHV